MSGSGWMLPSGLTHLHLFKLSYEGVPVSALLFCRHIDSGVNRILEEDKDSTLQEHLVLMIVSIKKNVGYSSGI